MAGKVVDLQRLASVWAGAVSELPRVRKAKRKASPCDNGICAGRIEIGDEYVEGEANSSGGGFGQDRYCADCLGGQPVVRRDRRSA